MTGIAHKFAKAFESRPVDDLADAPVTALRGVSESDAEHLRAAFGIRTVRDLGTNEYFLWAHAVATLAD
ncbi:hypothetical protein [Rhodococcus sp. SGAir0479]|uniref:hypothetical protein n=1 Tax=Rhodococcus sp. SGAir0479 TaxID=2567884 RepID=UPI0010CD071F|nr:hypothetical protein [Rhodococcus sp. SGAir0479]QCQ90950.1 hypothetical protein E7742_06645 [Rhodococcus sp. SGAir0479]